MARSFAVVINECTRVAHSNPRSVNFRRTANNDPNISLSLEGIASHLRRELTPAEMDWFELAGSIYAADLVCARGSGDADWARDIELHVPLRDPDGFQAHKIALQEIFADLTFDRLSLHLHKEEDPLPSPRYASPWDPNEYDCVALVSGGVDSFVGTAGLLENGRRPILLSHGSGAQTTPQKAVRQALEPSHGGPLPAARFVAETVRDTFPEREDSQRARTMLFMSVAALVAVVVEVDEVFLNENGVMAIHVPLTPARIGSLSTKTAYPPIVEQMARVASAVLGREITIQNTLISQTKPEVVQSAIATGIGLTLPKTASCWTWHWERKHCGVCIPCLTRRISFELAGITDLPHAANPLSNAAAVERPFARDNLVHLCTVVQEIQGLNDLSFELEHPEILDCGGQIDPAEARAMYRRWADQAMSILSRHPVPAGFMS